MSGGGHEEIGPLSSGPVLSVQDWKDYNEWKGNARTAEVVPLSTIILLGSSALLFAVDEKAGPVADGKPTGIPWLIRLRCELPTRDLRADGSEYPVKATYIGFGTDDNADFYEMFVEAMDLVGISKSHCSQVHTKPSDEEKSHLEASDVILIGGGDPYKTWRVLEDTYVGEQIRWRYYDGAVILGVGEGAMLLGQKAWSKVTWGSKAQEEAEEPYHMFKTFEMVPILVSPDFGQHSVALEKMLAEQPTGGRIVGLPQMGAVLFNRDGTLEPVWTAATEIRRAYHEPPGTIHRAVFLPPPRNLGSMVAMQKYQQQVEAKRKRVEQVGRSGDGDDNGDDTGDDDGADEEGEDLERAWLATCAPWCIHHDAMKGGAKPPRLAPEAVKCKEDGNQAFKNGEWVQAMSCYKSALQLEGAAWDESLHLNLAAALLKQADRYADEEDKKEDTKEDKKEDKKEESERDFDAEPDRGLSKQYYQQAWQAANVALHITGGKSAKAWYRRGRASAGMAGMENFASAVYDAMEALVMVLTPNSAETKQRLASWKTKLQTLLDTRYSKTAKEDTYYTHGKTIETQVEALDLQKSTTLDLGEVQLLPAALWVWQDLLKSNTGTLQTLELRDCAVRPEGAKCLSNALRQNSTLLKMDLSGNCLRDRGVKILFQEGLAYNSTLASLLMASNHATDASASVVASYLYGGGSSSSSSSSSSSRNASASASAIFQDALSAGAGPADEDEDEDEDGEDGEQNGQSSCSACSCSLVKIDLSFNFFGPALARDLAQRLLTLHRGGNVAVQNTHPLEHISLRCNLLHGASVQRLVGVFCTVEVLSSLDLSGMGTRRSTVIDLQERLRYKRVEVDFDTPSQQQHANNHNTPLPLGTF